ncbi:MAG: HEAT repeat domain-containing protein [Myxococcales bacterium]|nr:HEAT repeat domain-containing protein [Myxococcales bacterium]
MSWLCSRSPSILSIYRGPVMAKIRVFEPDAGPRAGPNLAALVLELNRLLRAISIYGPRHPSRENLLQRTFLLWKLELECTGAIEFRRNGGEICHDELGAIDSSHLAELIRAMEIHQLDRVRVTDEFDQDGFTRFAILLAIPTANLDQMCEGGFAGRLYSSSGPGIEVNGRSREQADPVAIEAATEPPAPPARLTFPSLEEDPFGAPAMAMQGEHLRRCLRELDRCDDDLLYQGLIDKILGWTRELGDAGQRAEVYRALLILTEHASANSDGDEPRTRMARSAMESLIDGPQIEFLIARACDCEAGGVRPTQILLQLGERSTPALLDALERETDRARSTRLASTVLALGECAVPALIGAIAKRTGSRLQLVVRLAGELQSPKMVPILANVFHDSGPALRKEAGMALVNIGNNEACDVLVRGLERDTEELSSAAALCLGVLRAEHTSEALLSALDRARKQRRYRLAGVIVRALGQLGSPQEKISRVLANILASPLSEDKSDGGNGQGGRELKCATLEVLDGRHGSEVRAMLIAALRDDDPAVSSKAHEVLNKRDCTQTN